ncbi:MAG: aspartate kinase [Dethiobacteria bacterium]
MKITVQKFGGTSVATPELREKVVDRIREAAGEGYQVVVVVSAMGRAGDPYATDTLKMLVESICADIPLRELDLMMSCGEILSAGVLGATLWKHRIPSRVMNGQQAGLVTDGVYGHAQVVDCHTEYLLRCLEKGEVPVVAGFQGATAEGEINTMGRGGSDTTAVILGAALDAERVDIFTDVNGIATADPHVFKDARIIRRLSYNEVSQLAYEGAKVVHPIAIEVAMKNNVTIAVRSMKDGGPGTIITGPEMGTAKDYGINPKQIITGIAHVPDLAQFMVDFAEPDADLELEMFEKLGEAGISIDLIGVFPGLKVFSVNKEMINRTERILKKLNLRYSLRRDCAKISVVGAGMRNIPGVMARIVKALQQKNIQILQTGDSNISICLLINSKDMVASIKTLHDHFELQKEGNVAASLFLY